ncbi:MAG: alkaline phosphatase D family protein [Thermoanaerobaculia bacterium]
MIRSILLALVLALPLTAQAPPEPATLLQSGPMVGYGEITESIIWVQTVEPTEAQVRYWVEGKPETARLSAPVVTSEAGDRIATFVLPRLAFGTTYEYEVYLDGGRVALDYPTRFRTQPMWRWRADPPRFTVAVGSCAYVNDPPFDRPGTPYGSDMRIFETIAAAAPDLMLWIGDNVYYREADWESESGMRYRYAHTRALEELQPLLAATHHYATWDDHDYGPNNSDRTYPMKEVALEIFDDYWTPRTLGTPETPGVFQKITWADVDFFLLDDRYHRSPNDLPPGSEKTMLGDEQLAWLMESLASSDAPFKIVVNGNQVLNRAGGDEALANFVDYERLLRFLGDARIEGVVFVSGDRHHGILMRDQPEGMYPLYDLTTSPLTAGFGAPREGADHPLVVPGTLVVGHNYATLAFSGPRTDRVLTMRLHDVDGRTLWERTIRASELRFQ